uniref:Uncharacterized protein n=1 Tax=Tanacetum cinerariifolium TaxID=118510 RepID=A0A699HQT2_TANCI|nr:hypothetical protein [Tanacetum cinerariifolium]
MGVRDFDSWDYGHMHMGMLGEGVGTVWVRCTGRLWGRGWGNNRFWREKGLGSLLGTRIDMIGPWTFDFVIFIGIDFDHWARKVPEL